MSAGGQVSRVLGAVILVKNSFGFGLCFAVAKCKVIHDMDWMRPSGLLALFCLLSTGFGWGQWNVMMHEGRRYVPVTDVARFYNMQMAASGDRSFRLLGNGRTLEGRAGQKEVMIDNVKFVLCFPIAVQNGQIILSAMDVTKIIEPVLRPARIKNPGKLRTVILDAGHGGHDSGAVGPYGRESDFALDVARRARSLLQQRGYNVLMTRNDDRFVPLERRSAFANQQKDAIFISIHFNKSRSGQASGLETFALAPRGVPSMGEEEVTVNALRAYPGHARDAENTLLAKAIHSAKLRYCPLPDRGVKRARFHVIRETSIPSVLIEGGFMNHPVDARLIASAAFRQRLAIAITDGVMRYDRMLSGAPSNLAVAGRTAARQNSAAEARGIAEAAALRGAASRRSGKQNAETANVFGVHDAIASKDPPETSDSTPSTPPALANADTEAQGSEGQGQTAVP